LIQLERLQLSVHEGESTGLNAVPSELHLAQLMKEVYANPEKAKPMGKRAALSIQIRWTWEAVTVELLTGQSPS